MDSELYLKPTSHKLDEYRLLYTVASTTTPMEQQMPLSDKKFLDRDEKKNEKTNPELNVCNTTI